MSLEIQEKVAKKQPIESDRQRFEAQILRSWGKDRKAFLDENPKLLSKAFDAFFLSLGRIHVEHILKRAELMDYSCSSAQKGFRWNLFFVSNKTGFGCVSFGVTVLTKRQFEENPEKLIKLITSDLHFSKSKNSLYCWYLSHPTIGKIFVSLLGVEKLSETFGKNYKLRFQKAFPEKEKQRLGKQFDDFVLTSLASSSAFMCNPPFFSEVIKDGDIEDVSYSSGAKGSRWNFLFVSKDQKQCGFVILTKKSKEEFEKEKIFSMVRLLRFQRSKKDRRTWYASHPTIGRIFAKQL